MRLFWILPLLAQGVFAQTAGPALSVDTTKERHAISPLVYGVNEGDSDNGKDVSVMSKYAITARRWGGDGTVTYNWKLDSANTASNWYFENFPGTALSTNPVDAAKLPETSTFETWLRRSIDAKVKTLVTVPIIGWTSSTRTAKKCSYSVAKYGAQEKTDQWAPDCGNGVKPDGKTNIQNDPNDVYMQVGPDFARDWVARVKEKFGSTAAGGVTIWELDNEPTWWHAVHKDIHPEPATFQEVLDRNIRWAEAIKAADPTAQIGGATPPGWESYFYSAKDLSAGWGTGPDWKYWNNPTDCKANSAGGVCVGFLPWYLQKMKEYEDAHGVRLVDYLDVHAYLSPDGLPDTHDDAKPANDTLRLTSTRTFWDPSYMPPRADMIGMNAKWGTGNPQLVRRLKKWIADYYPGTKIAITEYNWGAFDHITGFLAQTDILGIFGREGVDVATIWTAPGPTQPASYAFRMFLNYDGAGGAYGSTNAQATSEDIDQLTVFASTRADGKLTVLVLNKTTTALTSMLTVTGFTPQGPVEAWRYDATNLGSIRKLDTMNSGAGTLSATYPAWSATMLVFEPATATAPTLTRPGPRHGRQ